MIGKQKQLITATRIELSTLWGIWASFPLHLPHMAYIR